VNRRLVKSQSFRRLAKFSCGSLPVVQINQAGPLESPTFRPLDSVAKADILKDSPRHSRDSANHHCLELGASWIKRQGAREAEGCQRRPGRIAFFVKVDISEDDFSEDASSNLILAGSNSMLAGFAFTEFCTCHRSQVHDPCPPHSFSRKNVMRFAVVSTEKTNENGPSFGRSGADFQILLGKEDRWFCAEDVLEFNEIEGFGNQPKDWISAMCRKENALRLPEEDSKKVDIQSVKEWKPPVLNPQKIICIGLNYAEHAAETGAKLPEIPVVFNKFPNTLIGHQQPICLPSISEKVDYEAELVVVIGKKGKNIEEKDALNHVFGFTCGHDVSARDWQKEKPGKQWLLGKTFDTFAPLGPWIVTKDEISTPDDMEIQFRLNDQLMQDSSTKHFIFSIPFLISHLSKFTTLMPGDLLFTGTPSGVGVARDPQVFLKNGDTATVQIPSIGTLENPVVRK